MTNRLIRAVVLISGLIIGLPVLAQVDAVPTITYVHVPDSEPREHPLNITQMDLEVDLAPYQSLVKGRVTHHFTVLQPEVDSVVFDAIKISIKQATLNGRPVRTRSTDTTVVVYCEPPLKWDSSGTVAFTYEATPRKGLYFIGWQDMTGRMQRQIWTQGQAFDHRHWIPMYDDMNDKMITTTTVTFDSTYAVVSNGELKRTITNSDGTRTWQYAMTKPHSNYLLMLAVGRYDTNVVYSSSGIPMECYWYPSQPDAYQPTYKDMAKIMDFLEEEIGVPYPWGIYRQVPVADYIYGAMENTSATIFGDFYLSNERGQLDREYLRVNIHELTHQWFGDLITGRSRTHLWMQESFATFYPHLYLKHSQGEDAYEWSRRGLHNQALNIGKQNRLPIVHPNAGTARYYPKGASVIDMMRSTFGVDAVRRVLKHVLENHAYSMVETNDLYQAFQDTLGLSPRWFFDQWLYRGGEPHFEISTRNVTTNELKGASNATFVDIDQVHPVDQLTGYFRMPVDVEVHYDDETHDVASIWVEGPHVSVVVPNPENKTVSFVLFDPGSTLLKQVTFKKSIPELRAQLEQAPHMIDRYDALVALGGMQIPDMDMLDVIEGVLDRENFHAIRSEAVRLAVLLVNNGATHAWKAVERGLEDDDVHVRKATLSHLPMIPSRLQEAVEELLEDPSYRLIRDALHKLSRSFPAKTQEYVKRTAGVRSPSAVVEIERRYLQALQGDTSALTSLADYASHSFEFRTRQTAMSAFKTLGTLTQTAARAMIEAMFSTNSRLASHARGVLTDLVSQEPLRQLLRDVVQAEELESWQRNRLESLIR